MWFSQSNRTFRILLSVLEYYEEQKEKQIKKLLGKENSFVSMGFVTIVMKNGVTYESDCNQKNFAIGRSFNPDVLLIAKIRSFQATEKSLVYETKIPKDSDLCHLFLPISEIQSIGFHMPESLIVFSQ